MGSPLVHATPPLAVAIGVPEAAETRHTRNTLCFNDLSRDGDRISSFNWFEAGGWLQKSEGTSQISEKWIRVRRTRQLEVLVVLIPEALNSVALEPFWALFFSSSADIRDHARAKTEKPILTPRQFFLWARGFGMTGLEVCSQKYGHEVR